MGSESVSGQPIIRHLASEEDYEACLDLQRETWGDRFNELVPSAILKIAQKVSGIAAGAFRDGEMLGFVFGLAGLRFGRSAHWSHMLAVTPAARGLGLGKKLKLFQREYLLGLGVEVVYWSYDPLVARNANLNLNRLGARPTEYIRDMYGDDTGSELHSSLGTDRFVVGWEIGTPEVEASLEGHPFRAPLPASAERLVNSDLENGRVALPARASAADELWVEVPADIEKVKKRDPEEALAWRETTRKVLTDAMERGLRVQGFALGDPAGNENQRYFYYLTASSGK